MILPSLALLLGAASARAADPPVHLRVDGGTDFPWDVGGRATLELPGRLRLAAGAGWMPRGYLHVIDEAVIALGGFDRETADLIEDTLSSSLVLRFHGGWRPFPRAGFYAQGGYGLVTLGGAVSGATVLSMALDVQIPEWMLEGYDFSVDSTLHEAELELGWEGRIWKGLGWRAALGGVVTLRARSAIEPTFDPWLAESLVEGWCDESEAKIDAIYEQWVRSPVVTVAIGWQAF